MSLPNTGPVAYIALASNPTEEKGNSNTILTQSSSDRLPPSTLSRLHLDFGRKTQLYLRLSAFFIIEAGYIVLAAVCLAKPIPLDIHLNLTDAEIRGGFTVVFVIWQSIAILMGGYLVADAFSREWSAQLAHIGPGTNDNSPAVVPATIDRVSTMTSGFLDRSLHLLADRSSGTFKLAFLASLSFLALSPLGPGTINAATTLVESPTTVQIGRLHGHFQQNEEREFVTAQGRANLILRLEMIEHSPFGFKLQPNMLAPVPRVDLASFNGTIEYDSDVIEFHHDCHWEAPQFPNASGPINITSAGHEWGGATVGAGQVNVGSSIGPLSLTNPTIMEAVGSSAFIFSGGNSSFLDPRFNPPVPFAVDLGSLPTTFTAQGAGLNLASNSLYASLSSVLICDPRPQITGGRISITNDGTLTVIASGKTPIGNIPPSAANLIFTNAFQIALLEAEPLETANVVNNLASTMFMANSSTVNWDTAHSISPLDLPSINKNMDTFMLSAAKAYIDGYNKNGSSTVVDFDLDTVPALGHEQRLALTTSKPLFIATVVFVVIATVLLFALCRLGLAQKRYPFDLNHVLVLLGERGGSKASLLASRAESPTISE